VVGKQKARACRWGNSSGPIIDFARSDDALLNFLRFGLTLSVLADLVALASVAASLTPQADWVRVVRLSDRETIMGAALQKSSTDNGARFTERVLVRCPASLPPAIDRGAAKHLMTASEYVRRSVIDRLKADGIDPAQLAAG
jgi:hypothetical protein